MREEEKNTSTEYLKMLDMGEFKEGSYFFKWLLEQKDNSLFNSPVQNTSSEKDNFEVLTHATMPSESKPEDFEFSKKNQTHDQTGSSKMCPKRSERYTQRNERFSKDKTFNPKVQKKNRNVLSNLVHHLLKFISNRELIEGFILKTVKYYHLNITVEECFQFFEWAEEKLKSYVTEKCLKDFCLGSLEQQAFSPESLVEMSKLFRILCSKFYRQECLSSILLSSKLSLDSKALHIHGLRDVQNILLSLAQTPGSES